jgi:hypothetical protein
VNDAKARETERNGLSRFQVFRTSHQTHGSQFLVTFPIRQEEWSNQSKSNDEFHNNSMPLRRQMQSHQLHVLPSGEQQQHVNRHCSANHSP